MIDHVLIYVSDLVESKRFYEKAFIPFGYSIAFGEKGKFWSFDIGNGALFEIAQHQNKDKLTPCHIAFRAKNKDHGYIYQPLKLVVNVMGSQDSDHNIPKIITLPL